MSALVPQLPVRAMEAHVLAKARGPTAALPTVAVPRPRLALPRLRLLPTREDRRRARRASNAAQEPLLARELLLLLLAQEPEHLPVHGCLLLLALATLRPLLLLVRLLDHVDLVYQLTHLRDAAGAIVAAARAERTHLRLPVLLKQALLSQLNLTCQWGRLAAKRFVRAVVA